MNNNERWSQHKCIVFLCKCMYLFLGIMEILDWFLKLLITTALRLVGF